MSDDQDGCDCFFWYQPTRLVPDKRPLNGCVCLCVFDCLLGWLTDWLTWLVVLSVSWWACWCERDVKVWSVSTVKCCINDVTTTLSSGSSSRLTSSRPTSNNSALTSASRSHRHAETSWACQFYAAFLKICGPYKHQICGGNMWKSLSCISVEWA